jgi:glutathione S-transferase
VTAGLVLVSHALCPYVQRVAIALHEKAVAFERVTVDLDDKPPWFRAISPLGKTPVLQVGDAVLFESSVICEYLEEAYAPRLHPEGALERARHRAWMELGSAVLADLWGLETATDLATLRRKRDDIAAKLARVEAQLGDGPYFAGPAFSLVDAVFAPVFRYFDVFDPIADLGVFRALPRVRAWRAALAVRPSVVAAVGPDYADRMRGFLVTHDAILLRMTALPFTDAATDGLDGKVIAGEVRRSS